MKKNLLFIGLMLALSLSASAQYRGFSFGFKVGPNFNWSGSATKTAINQETKVGCDLGFLAEYYFTDNYALVSGINVSFLGGHYSFENGRLDENLHLQTFQVDRVYKTVLYEIPIMLKLSTNDIGKLPLRAYAQIGGGLGLVPQKVKVRDGIDGTPIPETWTVSNKEYSLFRFSLKAGAGVEYALQESLRVFLGVYFSHDFLNNINHIKPNYAGNYCDEAGNVLVDGQGNECVRTNKLNLLQNRVGIEVGLLF